MATNFVKDVKLSKVVLNEREMSLVNDTVRATGKMVFTRKELEAIHGTLRKKKHSPFFITKNMRCSVKGPHLYTLEVSFQEKENDLLDSTLLEGAPGRASGVIEETILERKANVASQTDPEIATSEGSAFGHRGLENPGGPGAGTRLEDPYYRESPARKRIIVPLHNKLSNDFCKWLASEHKARASQEERRVDIRFHLKGVAMLAELKTCSGVGTTRSIREAKGQLLEYNHYPVRKPADSWLIVLDEEPSELDKTYIRTLRDERFIPISIGIGWQTINGFSFHPKWPR